MPQRGSSSSQGGSQGRVRQGNNTRASSLKGLGYRVQPLDVSVIEAPPPIQLHEQIPDLHGAVLALGGEVVEPARQD